MKRKLLIVDDIRSNREILKNILGEEYEILEAAHGEEALAALQQGGQGISAVLLDLGMPVLDGFGVLEALQKSEPLSQIPVIVTTGQTGADSEERALKLGAKDYISKPYKSTIIKQRIRNTIRLRETAAAMNALQRDPLTGLYSREAFFARVSELIGAGSWIMACFDIDGFKVVNDQYGTARGDAVLRHVAAVFREGFEPVGGVCCRINSDNFAVLYPAFFCDTAALEAIRRRAAAAPGLAAELSFSIGRYVVDDLSLAPSAMYDRASLAQDSVKGRYDRNIAFYDEAMREKLLTQQRIVGEMDGALRGGQFEVWFQPQYNHGTGALIGAEALVRWRHPARGLVPPGDFIPVFEKNGFIYELDQFVWREVCRLLRRWRDEGRNPLPVSVNISRYDLFRAGLVDVLTGLVREYSLPAELLRLEITESAFAESTAQVVAVVRRLIAAGFTVEIDDFGSGYSSLNTLKSVPAQVVKLDMRFFEEDDGSGRGGNIVESVVRMTKWLGMSVIAEGVEEKAQADFLRSVGCSYIQGYLYAKPMPVAEYELHCKGAGKEERLLAIETVENLDNNRFWDPNSMDTLIFSSYVGGACIFEYNGGKTELLRVNEKYAQTFGEGLTADGIFAFGEAAKSMDEASRAVYEASIRKAVETGEEVSCETVCRGLYGIDRKLHIRAVMRMIARTGARALLYATVDNITERREAQERLRDASERLSAIMADVGSGVSAAVFDKSGPRLLFANERYFSLHGYTRSQYTAEVPDHYALINAEDRENVRERVLHAYRSHEPLRLEYRIRRRDGAERWLRVNFSATRFTDEKNDVQLGIFADITDEKRDEQELRNTTALLQTLMNDTPGGFARIRVLPDGSMAAAYVNDGLCKLLGMRRAEVLALYGGDGTTGVHPDDAGIVRDAVSRMFEKGEARSSRYRLRTGSGEYVWLQLFGRITKDQAGDAYLNIYYTDATEQMKAEEQQRELLDNLPGGAALYTYDGGKLSAVHLNRRYWELVGRAPREGAGLDVLGPVHPDDRAVIAEELGSAIRQKRDFLCDLRLRFGESGSEYRAFHIIGRVVPQEKGGFAIYAVYMPISDEAMSVQEMLPIALNAVLASSNDLSFVKDRDLRYICCSRSFAKMAGLESEKEVVGKSDCDLFDKALADAYVADDRALMASGESIVDKIEHIPGENGADRYSSTSKYLLYDSAGNVVGLYGSGRDITEARAIRSRLELLTNSIPGGIAVYEGDPARLDAIRLTYFSDGFCALFGYSRAEYEKLAAENPMSLVFQQDLCGMTQQIRALVQDGVPIDFVYRARTASGSFVWVNVKATLGEPHAGSMTVNAVFFDVTRRQEALGKLRMREEENRLAIALSGNIVCRYDIARQTLSMPERVNPIYGVGGELADIPAASLRSGAVSKETAGDYAAFYEAIRTGEKTGKVLFQRQSADGWRWLEARFATIFAEDGVPDSAVLSFTDVTDSVERETAYRKWQQSLQSREPGSYTLFRCNLSQNTSFDVREGTLLSVGFTPDSFAFDQRTRDYVEQCVAPEDAPRYLAFLDAGALLARYERGDRSAVLEYREKLPEGGERWLRLTVDLIEAPNFHDVEAYLLFEDIDREKREQLATLERADNDPLTGVMNRVAFAERVNALIAGARAGGQGALMMLDIDGFKQVNDAFGHAVGDEALVTLSSALRGALRRGDLVGRLGGDEFLVYLDDIPDDAAAAAKAKQLCALTCRSFSLEVQISGSIGIAVAPRDGVEFETLYKKADSALYHVKGSGKNNYAFYHDDMADETLAPDAEAAAGGPKKRRMLIVDDSSADHALLTKIFADEFIIEKAKDGRAALVRLRHYGAAISVVLLDLVMPGMDGFAVLEHMRQAAELRSIPVVVVSADSNRETGLRAIRAGASDFVSKPVDPDELRIRVQSAISKAENERLRAKNSLLEFENSEITRYRTVLARSRTAVVEQNWIDGSFAYDSGVSELLAGHYDDRRFWQILLTDLVADTATVQRMQQLVHDVAGDRQRQEDSLIVQLKTPQQERRWFRMAIYETLNEFGLANRLYLAFTDLGAEKPVEADEQPGG